MAVRVTFWHSFCFHVRVSHLHSVGLDEDEEVGVPLGPVCGEPLADGELGLLRDG